MNGLSNVDAIFLWLSGALMGGLVVALLRRREPIHIHVSNARLESLLSGFTKRMERLMTDLSNRIGTLSDDVTALDADVDDAITEINDLKQKVDAGTATPEDLQKLTDSHNKLVAMKEKLESATATAPPPPPEG